MPDFTLSLGETETGEYGNRFNGQRDADGVVTAGFTGTSDDLSLTFQGYDIDHGSEVELLLNGESLGFLAEGVDDALSPYSFTIPAADQVQGENVLSFVQTGKTTNKWGVTDIMLADEAPPDISLIVGVTEEGSYGNKFDGATDADGVVTAGFTGTSDDLSLTFQGYDIDHGSEVELLLNGESLGFLAEGRDDDFSSHTFTIPAASQVQGENILSFVQAGEPRYTWGITDVLLATRPEAPQRIAFLGDSLGDNGNLYALAEQILVDPLPVWPYAQKFSNGEVQSEVIVRRLGYEVSDPGLGGEDFNYAVGGARAIGPLTAGDFVDDDYELRPDLDPALLETRIDLEAQTDRFLADVMANELDPSTFAVHVLIGVNDLSNWEPDSIFAWEWDNEIADLVDDIIEVTRVNVQKLLAAGVGEIWVTNQADETFFPIYDELDDLTQLFADGVIDDMNDGLAAMVANFGDPRVRYLDLEELADDIEDDPRNYGLKDIETPILLGKGADYVQEWNPDLPADFDFARDVKDYGFLDYVHPTEGLHRVLGIYEAEVMQGNLVTGSTKSDILNGTAGDDIVVAGGDGDEVAAAGGDDVVLGGTGHDMLDGGAGSDLISGGDDDDTLLGGPGHDLLTGGFGNDIVDGGDGQDVIVDTAGSDDLAGGGEADFFLWFDGGYSGAVQGADDIDGGDGGDTLIFYLSDTATYDAAIGDYGDGLGSSFDFSSLNVTVTSVETIQFLDLSVDALELPDTGNPDLAARLGELQDWNFA